LIAIKRRNKLEARRRSGRAKLDGNQAVIFTRRIDARETVFTKAIQTSSATVAKLGPPAEIRPGISFTLLPERPASEAANRSSGTDLMPMPF
jgi:hypothetical protein